MTTKLLTYFFRLYPFTTKWFIDPCIIAWFFNWWHSYSPSVTNPSIIPRVTFFKYFTIVNFDTWYPTYNLINFIWQRSPLLWLISDTAIKWLDSIGDVIIQWTIGWVDIWSRDGKLRSFVWQTFKYVTSNGLLLRNLSKTNWRLTSPVSVIYNPLKIMPFTLTGAQPKKPTLGPNIPHRSLPIDTQRQNSLYLI